MMKSLVSGENQLLDEEQKSKKNQNHKKACQFWTNQRNLAKFWNVWKKLAKKGLRSLVNQGMARNHFTFHAKKNCRNYGRIVDINPPCKECSSRGVEVVSSKRELKAASKRNLFSQGNETKLLKVRHAKKCMKECRLHMVIWTSPLGEGWKPFAAAYMVLRFLDFC